MKENLEKIKNVASSATFSVQILFRQNCSWQGEIVWFEGEKRLRFRSLLEMITLMDEALNELDISGQEYTLRSWKDQLMAVGSSLG